MSLRCKAGQNPSVGKVNCLWMGKLSGECVRCSCCEALCSGSLPQYTFTGFLCNSRAFSGCLYDDIKAETFSFVYGICIVHAKLLDLFAYLWTIIWLHWMETKSFTGHVRSHISGFFCTVTVQKKDIFWPMCHMSCVSLVEYLSNILQETNMSRRWSSVDLVATLLQQQLFLHYSRHEHQYTLYQQVLLRFCHSLFTRWIYFSVQNI